MKVKAAVVPSKGSRLELVDLELDEPRPAEVQVKLVASGICHTDAVVRDQWYDTPLPAVLGHEGAGVVQAVGAGVTRVEPGDHVVLSFASCGSCGYCLTGRPGYCTGFYSLNFSGRRPDGSSAFSDGNGDTISSHFFGQSSFSTVSNVSERSVVKVDPAAPLHLLGPLGCGIQTGAGAVLNRLNPPAGSSIALFGTGAVGMAGLLAAKVAEATTIIAVDVVDPRLEFAKELGATHTVNSRTDDPVERIREITGNGVDYALDSTGVPAVFQQMSDSLAILGHGALVGATTPGTKASIDIGTVLLTGQTIHMVIEGDAVPQHFIPQLISLYERGLFPFDKLIQTYNLSQINTAFKDSESGRTLKPVVVY